MYHPSFPPTSSSSPLLLPPPPSPSDQYTCVYCKGKCRFTRSNLTCETCGSEQGVPVFEDEWDVSNRAYNMADESILHPLQNVDDKNKNQNKQQAINNALFMTIQDRTFLPDSTMDLAKSIFTTYSTEHEKTVKGEQRRLEICTACTYFATKSMRQGKMTVDRILELVFPNNIISLHWACKDLLQTLWNDKRYAELFQGRDIHITEAITRLSKLASPTSGTPVKDIYKLAHKILDKINRKDEAFVSETRSERLAACLVFVSCKLLKRGIPLNAMAILSGTNEGHLLKLERRVKELLQK